MEESVKISGKKKLPAIPSNYVTLRQLQERWVKEQERKKRENEEARVEEQERVDAGRGSRQNGHFPQRDRGNDKPEEEKIEAGFPIEVEGVEKEKRSEESKKKKHKRKSKNWKNKRVNDKDEKAAVENGGEEVVGAAAHAPLPTSVENDKREEKVVENEPHAPEQACGEARSERKPRIITRKQDRTAEIGQGFGAMSMNGVIRTRDRRGYGGRQYGDGYSDHRDGMFRRRREMVWVKKGEVSDKNVGGIQSSSSSSKCIH